MIKIELDFDPIEDEHLDRQARLWRAEQIKSYCESYGWPSANCHEGGCELLMENFVPEEPSERAQEVIGPLINELEDLCKRWNNGAFYEALESYCRRDAIETVEW